ncbi:MAG: hypothetical protein RSA91_08000, partial [Bacilli bacterium]
HCEIEEYSEIISKWLKMFDLASDKNFKNYIKIYKEKTIYCINESENEINGKIIHTDLYPLFYNIIANIINNENNMLLHSAVLWYNNKGILVLGDFGSGKTSLCIEAKKCNMKTLSTDQTYLIFKDRSLKMKNGSRYMKIRNDDSVIIKMEKIQPEIKIIINLIGLCDNAASRFDLIDDANHKIKILFKYFTWHSDIPLFSDNSILSIDRLEIKRWLTSINTPMYNVRGNNLEIIKNIKELLK